MKGSFNAACVQLSSGREVAPNLSAASRLIRRARESGADFIMTPETTDLLEPKRRLLWEKLRPENEHRGVAAFQDLAAELGCWLLSGSLLVRLSGEKAANRSYLFDPSGEIAARYDKIHMFDVEIPDGQKYRESSAYQSGREAVTAELPWGRLGLTICYDLRFPQLYRALAQTGALFMTVPSAFTRFTGEAHWHTLLRARAIETGSFIFAPAQCGRHAEGRETFGHSLIISPWGEVLADGADEPGVVMANIDPGEVRRVRGMIPSLAGDHAFAEPPAGLHKAAS